MIVIVDKSGQLANRLFVFATFVAFSIEYKVKLANPSFDEYAQYFTYFSTSNRCQFPAVKKLILVPVNNLFRHFIFKVNHYLYRVLTESGLESSPLHLIHEIKSDPVDLSSDFFVALAKQQSFLLCKGWLYRDNKNFLKQEHAIREIFKPLPIFQAQVDQVIQEARQKRFGSLVIGVHIRRGDYKAFEGGKYYYDVDIYLTVMKKVELFFSPRQVTFIICSNERQDISNFDGFDVVLGGHHLVTDLYTFAACDYLIGPPSTYTMWASFYGNIPLCMIEEPQQSINEKTFKKYIDTLS